MSRFPRAYRQALAHQDQANVDRAIRTSTGSDLPPTVTKATLPGDKRRLRGIPVVGGASGTSPGTDPLAELLRKERTT